MSLRKRLSKSIQRLEKPYDTYNQITLSRSALLHNFDLISSFTATGFVFPVLKSNAYGHGIEQVVTILKERTFPYIAVDGFYESLLIHGISKQPVLVMGAVKPDNFKRMSFKNTAFVVHDEATVKAIGATRKPAVVHMELDTGMVRHGVSIAHLPGFLELIKTYPNLKIEGIMTHLADADNADSNSFTVEQVQLYDAAVDTIIAAGFKPQYFHIAQSAGSVKVVSRYANAVRAGIALYGINPLELTDEAAGKFKALRPVLSLYSTITKVVEIQPGTTVSYGRTFTAKKASKIGILPLGYYEGFSRSLSNTGLVQYKTNYLEVAGRVNMNHTMIDLGTSSADVGDAVCVISNDKKSKVSIAAICEAHKLFSYELLVKLNENIRRRIVS